MTLDVDWWVTLAGFIVGVVVGLTGMGGGALMTPILVLIFGVPPLTAVSSDLVASAVMKPVGGLVHAWRGTVDRAVVGWLCLGSVPAAFTGVFIARILGNSEALADALSYALGCALLVAVAGLLVKTYIKPAETTSRTATAGREPVRKVTTLLLGALGGLIVGITSVGAGSLIVVGLLAIYPTLRLNDLVGTDLVQAVPMVASAALAHVLFGDFQLGLTAAMVIGSVPGVLIGALVSSRAPAGPIRWAIVVVLLISGLKLLGLSTNTLGIVLALVIVVGPLTLSRLPRMRATAPPLRARVKARAGRATKARVVP